MAAGVHNFDYEEGEYWSRRVRYRNSDGTDVVFGEDWTARMSVRSLIEDSEFLIDMTTENGCIVLSEEGWIDLVISVEDGVGITTDGVYDLFLYPDDGEADKVIKGIFRFKPSVTRLEAGV